MTSSEIFGIMLQSCRRQRKLSQEAMAEICNISTRHYCDLENGRVNPHLNLAAEIAAALEFDLNELKGKPGE